MNRPRRRDKAGLRRFYTRLVWALRARRGLVERYPVELAPFNLVRLRSTAEVASFLDEL